MLKKILIGVIILVVILAAAFMYLQYRNRSLSPPGSASLTNNGLTVSVDYSRPSVRDRVIFGTKEEKALASTGALARTKQRKYHSAQTCCSIMSLWHKELIAFMPFPAPKPLR
jgi:hypothetical protein